MKSNNVTVTDARLMNALKKVEVANTNNNLNGSSSTTKTKIDITVGELNRFFYNTQEAEVKINGKLTSCKLTTPVAGSVSIFFTPFSELEWDKNLRKTYFKPYESIKCLILQIDKTYYVVSYFQDDIELPNIVDGGVLYLGGYNTSIQLGGNTGGIYYDTGKLVYKDWMNPEQRNKVYTSDLTEDNVTNTNYYTKEEVDELLEKLKEELTGETGDESDTTTEDDDGVGDDV